MRVNVYAEEMTDQIEIISKEVDGHTFTGLRLYLHLPVSKSVSFNPTAKNTADIPEQDFKDQVVQLQGPFIHRPGDDDSSAVTFWGKKDLRTVLKKMLSELDAHYKAQGLNHE